MRRLFFFLALMAGLAAPALALEPARRDVIVLSGRVWDGFGFREMFLPSTFPTLHLVSGRDSALSFVGTQEYYWPLSRQVYVDFEAKREDMTGLLEISQNGRHLADVPLTDYAILYPEGAVNGDGQLLWGDDATRAYAAYQEGEKAFARRYVEAQAARTAYERKLIETGAARIKGVPAPVLAPPPALPEPSLRLVTKPVPAYRVALPPGAYEMQLLQDGRPVASTRRHLVVADLQGSSVVVGDVIPEERWTRPIASNMGDQRIYARPGATFYLTLTDADRFPETDYIPVVSPQAEAVDGRDTWVRRKPSGIGAVSLALPGSPTAVTLTPLKVEQTDGSGFGYRVRPVHAGEKPDMTAFAIAVPLDGAVTEGAVSAVAADGRAFHRAIAIVQPRQGTLAFALALMPMVGWACLRFRRGRSRQRTLRD